MAPTMAVGTQLVAPRCMALSATRPKVFPPSDYQLSADFFYTQVRRRIQRYIMIGAMAIPISVRANAAFPVQTSNGMIA